MGRNIFRIGETPEADQLATAHLQGALYGILDIIKTNPVANYDKFVKAFKDPGTVLEI